MLALAIIAALILLLVFICPMDSDQEEVYYIQLGSKVVIYIVLLLAFLTLNSILNTKKPLTLASVIEYIKRL